MIQVFYPLLSLFVLVIGTHFINIFLIIWLTKAEYAKALIGLFAGMGYLGLLLASLKTHYLIHRIGHIRTYIFGCVFSALTILTFSFTNVLPIWMLLRLCLGLGVGVFYVALESWLLAVEPLDSRSHRLALYMISLYMAQGLAPLLLDNIDLQSATPYTLSAFFCCLAMIPAILEWRLKPALPEIIHLKVHEMIDLCPYSFWASLFSGIVFSSFLSFIPQWALSLDLSVSGLMSFIILGGFLSQWPIAQLAAQYNKYFVLGGLNLATCVPAMILTMLHAGSFLYLNIFLLGFTSLAIYPLAIALGVQSVGSASITQMSGFLLFAYSVGAIVGPIVMGILIDIFSRKVIFYEVSTLCCFVLGMIGIYLGFLDKKEK